MNLFIDTNIYLAFYHFTSDDLEELRKLAVLVRERQVTLLLPSQVIDEFTRNRESKIADALRQLKGQRLNLQFPQLCKDYEEYQRLRRLQRDYEQDHSRLVARITEDANGVNLKADNIIEELFDVATPIDCDDTIVERARRRCEMGNPPGKPGSLGDAINWEALLTVVEEGADLHFLSDDRDFQSPLGEAAFNSFLVREWSEEKHTELHYYRRLSAFFQEHFPDIELAQELEKELLIRNLHRSGTFQRTHKIVAKLQRYEEFTHTQANEILEAAVENSQVGWIANDSDVKALLESVVSKHQEHLDPDNLAALAEILGADDAPVEGENDDAEDDDLPF